MYQWTGEPGWWFSFFKNGNHRVCLTYLGITLLSTPGKTFAMLLERKPQPIVKARLQEEKMQILWNSGPALQPCRGVLGFCPSSVFVDFEKAYILL